MFIRYFVSYEIFCVSSCNEDDFLISGCLCVIRITFDGDLWSAFESLKAGGAMSAGANDVGLSHLFLVFG